MKALSLAFVASLLFVSRSGACDEPNTSFSFFPNFIERLPGAAREIPRSLSASRDTPLFEGAFGPHAQSSLGIELGTIRVFWDDLVSMRLGVHFLAAFENADQHGGSSLPFVATELFRGVYGSSLAFTSPRWNHAALGPHGAFEVTLLYAHETDHADADFVAKNPGFLAPNGPHDVPAGGGGDYLETDYGLRLAPHARVELTFRALDRIFIAGPFAHVPGADATIVFAALPGVRPYLSLYAEHGFADRSRGASDDTSFVRAMLGLYLPGRYGIAMPFASADGGNGKGYLVNRKEAHVSIGIRYSPF